MKAMKAMKSSMIATAGATALLAIMGASPASATLLSFTWNPQLTTPTPLSSPSGTSPQSPQFTADTLGLADYALINATNPNDVTENAVLEVSSLTLSSGAVTPPGFLGATGATPYELYFVLNSTSSVAPGPGALSNDLFGTFSTLSYTLYGAVGGGCTFSVAASGLSNPTAACAGDQILTLATGQLTNNGLNSVEIQNYQSTQPVPSANADASIASGANAGGFFVSPSILSNLNFQGVFANAFGETTSPGAGLYVIDQGAGSLNLVQVAIPEPETLAMFGFGLMGLGWAARRRYKKS
jgi:hypothetical protein